MRRPSISEAGENEGTMGTVDVKKARRWNSGEERSVREHMFAKENSEGI